MLKKFIADTRASYRYHFADHRGDWTKLHRAAADNFSTKIKHLLKHGTDIESVDSDGTTRLIFAAMHNHHDAVDRLLKAGANVDAYNDRGQRALHFAVLNNNYRLAQLLLDAGATINVSMKGGFTPITLAEQHSREIENLLHARRSCPQDKFVFDRRPGGRVPSRRKN